MSSRKAKKGAYPKKVAQPNLEITPRNCNACSDPDSREDMVECEKCQKWYHFTCAGVDESVKQSSFACTQCIPRVLFPPTNASRSSKLTSSSAKAGRIQLELQRLEEEKALKEKSRKEKEILEEEYLAKKFQVMQSLIDNDVSEESFSSSRSGINKVKQWLNVQQNPALEKVSGVETNQIVIPSSAEGVCTTQRVPPKQFIQIEGLQAQHRGHLQEFPRHLTSEQQNEKQHIDQSYPAAKSPRFHQQPNLINEQISDDPPPLDKQIHPSTQHHQSTSVYTSAQVYQTAQLRHSAQVCPSAQVSSPLLTLLPGVQHQRTTMQQASSAARPPPIENHSPKIGEVYHRKEVGPYIPVNYHRNTGQCTENAVNSHFNIDAYDNNCTPLYSSTTNIELSNIPPSSTVNNTMVHSTPHPDIHYQCSDRNRPSAVTVSSYQSPVVSASFVPNAPTANLSIGGPTSQQLAARHVISKELPIFSGDPTDWPIFITSYNNSSQMCGYSDSENIMRLQRCLRGSALEAVKSFLLHPSTLSQVLSTLHTLYGRPELIASVLVNKVKATPSPKADKLESLVNFGIVVQNLCAHLKAVGMENYLRNPSLMQELVDKLPANVRLDWALYQRQVLSPDLSTFGEFMSSLVAAVSCVVSPFGINVSKDSTRERNKDKAYINSHTFSNEESKQNTSSLSSVHHSSLVSTSSSNQPVSCVVCNRAGHKSKDCLEFRKLDVNARWKVVQEKHLCRRCLIPHGRRPCKSTVCGIDGCPYRHHKLLHNPKSNVNVEQNPQANTSGTVSIHKEDANRTLFRLIPVTIYGKKESIDTFAFQDDGSELTLIDCELASQLDVVGPVVPLCMQWTGDVSRSELNSQLVQLRISRRGNNRSFPLKDVRTVANLNLPAQTLQIEEMVKSYPHLNGIPVQSYSNAKPRLLIGLNNAALNASLKIREGRVGEPVAAKTRLGWSVYGNNNRNDTITRAQHVHFCKESTDESLHQLVHNFFSMDGCGTTSTKIIESEDDQRARKILEHSTKRTSNGRYETGLLWRYDAIEFPDSRPMAERRLQCLERRLGTDIDLYNNVRSQIAEYQRKGYAHKLTEDESKRSDPRRIWYLPLGVVVNPKKPGKVRVVWDAAAKVSNVSFNSMMLTGPDLLSSLIGVLFRYRQREIAVAADIKEMFHQIEIQQDDRSSQRFLWRDSPTLPIDIFVMDVAIFGSKCSPCSSQYVKNLNAREHEQKYPRASIAIQKNHYVDDYLDSFDTVEEAVEVGNEVKTVHAKAKFEIRNWLSNSRKVIESIGGAANKDLKQFHIDKVNEYERVLGMVWFPEQDVFRFTVLLRSDLKMLVANRTAPTKRELLRFVMSFFDPLGMISMFIIHGKIMLQDVWKSGVGWDEKNPIEIYSRWTRWIGLLENLASITIPRCYFSGYDPRSYDKLELHVFADASESAYACVAYFRISDRGRIRCALVSSKSKVAPVKCLSIPRLELQVAVIAARLAKTISSNHSLIITKRYFWTDSSTVLSWIGSDHRRYSQYVAFRIGEILSESSIAEWRWVPTAKNVADEATKWKNVHYDPSSRWFNAPEFLYDYEERWPTQKRNLETSEELRVVSCYHRDAIPEFIDYARFSKYERLIRVIAYVVFFIRCCKKNSISSQQNNGVHGLTREDLHTAEVTLFKTVQAECYPSELVKLTKNIELPWHKRLEMQKNRVLYKLSPFLDEEGVVRSESRISNAIHVPYSTRNPVILPKLHIVTRLLVDSYHRKLGHSNNETVVNEIRQNFHISNLRAVVRRASKECVWCHVYKRNPKTPRMAPLPVARLTPYVRPFTYVGIDYFGPFLIRIGRSNVKRWVALFTCLTVRAVHLEVAHSLSADSCKLAIRRFIARRGAPQEIYSDQGTNFQAVSKEMAAEINNINKCLASKFTNTNTQWNFNPPATPHMGGIWERMVRSIKAAMISLSSPRKPDDESFVTILSEAESMVNSRPLTYMPLESETQEALTPNHFLLMSSSGVIQPPKPITEERTVLRSNWNLVQLMVDQFWKRWLREYLPSISNRSKWLTDVEPLKIGDLVVTAHEQERNSWTRGRVVKAYPGKDGRVRRVDIQTMNGIFQRPVSKLVVLNVGNDSITGPVDQQYGAGDVTNTFPERSEK